MSEVAHDEQDQAPVDEQDPRYPSGAWTGYWLQRSYPGRHAMELNLRFANGRVQGEGHDEAGKFTIKGRYSAPEGLCDMVKRYAGSGIDIRWDGWHGGAGVWICGVWKTPYDTGRFFLWPADQPDPSGGEPASRPAEASRV